jgi:hypothetical protein
MLPVLEWPRRGDRLLLEPCLQQHDGLRPGRSGDSRLLHVGDARLLLLLDDVYGLRRARAVAGLVRRRRRRDRTRYERAADASYECTTDCGSRNSIGIGTVVMVVVVAVIVSVILRMREKERGDGWSAASREQEKQGKEHENTENGMRIPSHALRELDGWRLPPHYHALDLLPRVAPLCVRAARLGTWHLQRSRSARPRTRERLVNSLSPLVKSLVCFCQQVIKAMSG